MSSEPTVSPATLLAFLQDPASYPYSPDRIEIVQTHISYVALAPPYVYKVKKAVDLGFLDFSTRARRRHFCEEEVRVNRRLCPDLYLGVVAITQEADGLRFEGPGPPVTYAVKMCYLPDDGFLHRRLRQGTLSQDDLARVVDTLADFYRQTPRPEVAEWGRIERLRINTDENAEQTRAVVGDLIAPPAYEALRWYNDWFYTHRARLLNERRVGGHLVDGHGDLRLEHIHLTPERVCIYDAIEFNERFRFLDVAADMAFLAMDLDVHGRPDLARFVVRRLAERRRDPALYDLVDFYKCYRAYVRGKVEMMRSREDEVPPAEREASRDRARQYFRQALRYAVVGSQPLVLVVMGRTGSGKTTQARALADALGWAHVSSDRIRKEQAGVPLHRRGSSEERARLYAAERTDATYAALTRIAVERAEQGQGTVLDATFGDRHRREALREALRARGVPWVFVELEAAPEARRARLQARETAPDVVSDARLEDVDRLDARYDPPDALEDAVHLIARADAGVEATTLEILRGVILLEPGRAATP
ncbi:hypothetical protein AWN76_000970 [Rhodothermaceae bacterium RA]|nr:hypothetical protein AWN76_000970 [Rhodothermaceae bacterium RA]